MIILNKSNHDLLASGLRLPAGKQTEVSDDLGKKLLKSVPAHVVDVTPAKEVIEEVAEVVEVKKPKKKQSKKK